jgi:DNA-binding NtrC family response regulator
LVADDDKLIRWSLKEIFSQEGYEVDTVASYLEALQQAENTTYGLIFTDCEIDDDDGLELIHKMKSIQPDAKVVIISALSRQKIESRLEGLNIFAIVEKPFQSDDIVSITRRAIG